MAVDSVSADVRYTFTGQFLEGATIFVRRAREIEAKEPTLIDERILCEHRALITTTVMQCAAALETEAHEFCVHGPGAHLGSDGTDHGAKQFLAPLAKFIDRQETLDRYEIILHVLHKPALQRGAEPYQSAKLLVQLRNELVHYKSLWGQEMASRNLFAAIEALKHKPPPFTKANQNFFPHRCLSADCGAWAIRSARNFLEAVYRSLEVPSRFKDYGSRLEP